MHRLAESLTFLNRNVHIIQQHSEFHPGWFSSNVKTISYSDWKILLRTLSPSNNIIILPETYINVFRSYAPGFPKIIFNQNGSYSFGSGDNKSSLHPSSVLSLYEHEELLHVLCVSDYDYHLIVNGFSVVADRVSLIVNSIENQYFVPPLRKKRQVSFMPRKNPSDARAVLAMLQRKPWFSGWNIQPISGCTQLEVLQHLQNSTIFLAFGHPEGFGLPLAEAAACGCALVGYTGLGGKEIFSLSKQYDVAFPVEYGDWLGFVNSCESIISSLNNNPTLSQNAFCVPLSIFVSTTVLTIWLIVFACRWVCGNQNFMPVIECPLCLILFNLLICSHLSTANCA